MTRINDTKIEFKCSDALWLITQWKNHVICWWQMLLSSISHSLPQHFHLSYNNHEKVCKRSHWWCFTNLSSWHWICLHSSFLHLSTQKCQTQSCLFQKFCNESLMNQSWMTTRRWKLILWCQIHLRFKFFLEFLICNVDSSCWLHCWSACSDWICNQFHWMLCAEATLKAFK